MVDGVGKNAVPPTTLKLKGKDGQTINLDNLEGIQQTEQNKALFKQYDKNKNGIIDKDEAIAMRNNLQSIAGNSTISKRELNKHFGKDTNAMEALSKLASQQEALTKGSDYREVNGNSTTYVHKGASNEDSYTYKQTETDEFVTREYNDGSKTIQYKSGSRIEVSKDGVQTTYNTKGQKVTVTNPDGSTILHTADGNKTIMQNAEGQTTRIIERKNNQETRTDFEYADGKTISRTYNGSTEGAPLNSINVSEKKDGHNIDTKYSSEEDLQNGRPSEQITDPHNPTLKTVTKFTYDDKGNVKAETTNSAGETTTEYTNAKGEKISDTQFGDQKQNTPSTYTVPKGHGLNRIASDLLKQQGIENPTPKQIEDARNQIIEANKDQIHTMKEGKYKGNQYFYADAQIKVPQFNQTQKPEQEEAIDGGTLPEVVITAKKISPEVKAKRQELQARLGSDFEVGYSKDGKLEVRDKKGNILPEATKKANEGTGVPEKNELTEEVLKAGDDNKSQSLDKAEFKNFIINTLGLELTDINRSQIEKLIEMNFNALDNINADGTISREELDKNAKAVLENIGNQIDEMESE